MCLASRYTLVKRLGAGGFGEVWEAEQHPIGRHVAVKILHADRGFDDDFVQRFRDEARIAVRVEHQHIVSVLDYGEVDGLCYLAMERLDGETLQARFEREGRFAPRVLWGWLEPIARALAYAHRQGFIHRDLKPENIFLARPPGASGVVPKLLDFGLSRPAERDARRTATGIALGTPAYMAPEQAAGESTLTAAIDQWALAAVFYELVSGQLPHGEGRPQSLMIRRATEAATPLIAWMPAFDRTLNAVIMRALSLEADARYPDLDAFRTALDAALGEATGVRPPEPGLALVAPASARPAAPRDDRASAETLDDGLGDTLRALDGPGMQGEIRESAAAPRGPKPRRWWLGLVVFAMALTLGAMEWSLSESPTVARQSRGALGRPRFRPLQAQRVRFDLEFQPGDAEIWLDGLRLGTGHAVVDRPRDGRRWRLEVRARGFLTFSDVLTATGDVRVSRTLDPDPTPRSP